MEEKFLVDFMLGKLAKWLKIWGFDAEYFVLPGKQDKKFPKKDRHEIIYKSLKERRIILTRDHTLSSKKAYKLILIKSNFLNEQIKQAREELGLELDRKRLFSRCTICNVPIEKVEKSEVLDKVPAYVFETHNDFSQCPVCRRIYWQGTHFELLKNKIDKQ